MFTHGLVRLKHKHTLFVSVFSQLGGGGLCICGAVLLFHFIETVRVCFLDDPDPEGQGFCQAGFSVDFTKVRVSVRHLWRIFRPCQRTNTEAPFGDL